MKHDEFLQVVGKTVLSVVEVETNDEYEEEYIVSFTDGSKINFVSIDHHDCYGMILEWL